MSLRPVGRVGFIGLGLMGRPMALNLVKKGFAVTVHSRSRGPVDALVERGASAASGAAGVAAESDVLITMLPDTSDVVGVLEGAVFGAMRPGTVVIDMSTIAPAAARSLAESCRSHGGAMLDAPERRGDRRDRRHAVDHGRGRRRRARTNSFT